MYEHVCYICTSPDGSRSHIIKGDRHLGFMVLYPGQVCGEDNFWNILSACKQGEIKYT